MMTPYPAALMTYRQKQSGKRLPQQRAGASPWVRQQNIQWLDTVTYQSVYTFSQQVRYPEKADMSRQPRLRHVLNFLSAVRKTTYMKRNMSASEL